MRRTYATLIGGADFVKQLRAMNYSLKLQLGCLLGFLLNQYERRVSPKGEPYYLPRGPSSRRMELHHRPALCNRERAAFLRNGRLVVDYTPAANDPEYLEYLPADEHDIETRVRGQHGDYSDLAKARKRKRKERKAKRKATPSLWGDGKRKWPKRKFPKRA